MKPLPPDEKARGNGQVTTGQDSQMQGHDATAGGNDKTKWPFIPAWLDNFGLSQPTFRIYCHMLRSADNTNGIAWPSIKTICKVCQTSKSTAIRSIKELIAMGLLDKLDKPFQGSCRYRPTVPSEGRLVSNSVTRGNIERSPIVPLVEPNSPSGGTPIVSPEGKEGNPKKAIQGRQSKGDDLQYPFPSPAFKEVWSDWEQHRREIKKKLTPTSTRKQFAELLAMGEADSIAAINHSISKGWTGIFPAHPSQPAKSPAPNPTINPNRRGKEETL